MKLALRQTNTEDEANLGFEELDKEQPSETPEATLQEDQQEEQTGSSVGQIGQQQEKRPLTYKDVYVARVIDESEQSMNPNVEHQTTPAQKFLLDSLRRMFIVAVHKRFPEMGQNAVLDMANYLANGSYSDPNLLLGFNQNYQSPESEEGGIEGVPATPAAPVDYSSWLRTYVIHKVEDAARRQKREDSALSLDQPAAEGDTPISSTISDPSLTPEQQYIEEDFVKRFKNFLSNKYPNNPKYRKILEALMESGARESRKGDESYELLAQTLKNDYGLTAPNGKPYDKQSILGIMKELQSLYTQFKESQGEKPDLKKTEPTAKEAMIQRLKRFISGVLHQE